MTDNLQPQSNPVPLNTVVTAQSVSFSIFDEADGDGSIFIAGTSVGIADDAEVTFLITDQFGNTTTVLATVSADEFVVMGIDTSMLSPGPLTIIASVNDLIVEPTNPFILVGLQAADPITIETSSLDANNKISIQGTAKAFKKDEITLVIRDTNGSSVTATALVDDDGNFSVSGISTQGLVDGVLVIDVLAQTSNGSVSIENADTLILTNQVPVGTDKTLSVNEDAPLVLTLADFGYVQGGTFAMTGIKIAGLTSQGTLKLDGNALLVDDFVSVAKINAGKLVFQGAQNGNGTAYDSFKFKVMDNRPTNNEDPTPNTITINVTAVNDAPVQTTAGAIATVNEDSASTAAVALWSTAPVYAAGPGNEASQTLSYKINTIPSFITLFKADGTTAVTTGITLTAAEFAGLKYKTVGNTNGTGTITFDVIDSGSGTAPNVNTLSSQSVSMTVTAVNDVPVVSTAGAIATVNEDSSNATAVALWSTTPVYATGGGSDESGQILSYKINTIPGFITLFKADGTTAVTTGTTLTAAEFAGLKYKTVGDANGSGSITFDVIDSGSGTTTNVNTLSNQSVSMTVTDVNDAPVVSTAGAIATVNEDSASTAAVALWSTAPVYAAGPGNEASQTLSYKINTIPSFITLFKADGTTAVTTGITLTAAEFAGLKYKTVGNTNGTGTITFDVIDSGSVTAPSVNTLSGQSVTMTVNAVNDAPVLSDTTLTLTAVKQDAAVPTGAVGALVSALVGGQSDIDASPVKGMAITGVNTNGTLFYSTNGGTTWTAATGISNTNALLLGSDTDNRIYFKPDTGYFGTAADAITFRAWDQTSGTEGTYASTATNGGTSAFSAATDTISQQVVRPVTINTVSTDSIVVMNEAVPLSGTADANATVTLNINGTTRSVTADSSGNWTYDSKLVPLMRYVMVRKDLSGDPFALSEIRVIVDGTNIANTLGIPITFGSGKVEPGAILPTYGGLTDGSTSGDSYYETLYSTGEAWVELDLGGYYRVDSIELAPRGGWDGRLIGAKIYTSLTQQSLLSSAELLAASTQATPTVRITNVTSGQFTATQPNATNEDKFINGANVITATQTVSGISSNDTENVPWQAIAPGPDGTPPVFPSGPTASVVENIATSTAVYDAQAIDAGAGNDVGITYSLGGVDASKFDISATGVVTFKASPNFEAPSDVGANNVHNIIVTAKDASNNAAYQNVAITVTNINDAPTGTNKIIDMNEDATRSFSAADFGFADAPGENHTLSAVVITSLPASGTLKLGTVNVLVGAVIPVADLGSLNYTPALNVNGNAYTSFGFRVRDSGGTANGGIDTSVNANTITFNIAPVNDPATFSGDISKAVSETNDALTVTGTLTVADVDSATTVTALSNVNGTAGHGKFSITTAGAWTYVMNTAQNQFVAGQTYTDTIEVTTSDGTKQVISVVITGTNDAPTMTTSSTSLVQISFSEDGAPVVAQVGTITLADVDSANLTGATVRVVNFADATSFVPGDLLTYTIPGGSGITGDYNTSTGVLTFTGTATQAQYQSLLDSVKFSNSRDDLAGGARNVYWSVKDASGATSNEPLSRLNVTRYNDAPVLADTTLNLTTIQPTTAETQPSGPVGVLVSSLVGGVTDGDGTTVAKGIAIIAANDALGKVFFSVNNGTSWFSPVGTISSNAALLLKADATTRVYFRPNAGVEGNIADALTIRAWDTTDNKSSLVSNNVSLHAITATGGITPYSAVTDTVALSVLTTASAGLSGTAGGEPLTGTAGNDVIVGNGGADQISAAAGNDKVVLNDSNVIALSADNTPNIDGGTGINTLKLTGTELVLDLTNATVKSKVDNFSVVDITSNVNNLLKLNLLNVQTLSGVANNAATPVDESKMLVVNADTGDAVVLQDAASWSVINSLSGSSLASTYGVAYGFSSTRRYSQYSKDGATLFVDELAPVADIVGTSGNNTLTGTANADVIYGNGGVDTINAGAGNDTVILTASSISALTASTNTAAINGQAGVNTLKISGINQTMDLTNLTVNNKLDNFNVIDLKQGSGNKFKLHLDQVLSLAGGTDNAATAGVDESKMLVLQGNGGAQLNRLQLVDAINWSSVTNLGGTSLQNTYGAEYGFEAGRSYTQYTNGVANLFVDQTLFVEALA
ncbi:VCBS domain-containing protein [Limnohabitans sp.]|uniref:VCBS domain-containing protein n=1 Tax=Limnohabitans sp. TaxID=1907725 RepID=UPI0031FBF0E4